VRYRVVFDAAGAGGLSAGAPVTLDAKRIGSVTASQLRYDPAAGKLQVVAELALNPHRIALVGDAGWAADPRPQLNAMLNALIGQGLRAQLGSTVPLVGGKTVELAFVASPGGATLGDGPVPEIPAGAQGGISGTLAAINGVAQKLQSLPLDQIGQSINQAAQHVAALTGSPALTQSLQHLDTTLADIQQITGQAKGQVQPILADLHQAARQADGVVADVRRLVSSNPLARSQPGSGDLAETLYEVTRAARSLRQLADYMDRHPEALLHGRGGG
jgi:paraquat-inducible protein B